MKGAAGAIGGIAAAAYVKPTLTSFEIPVALAASGGKQGNNRQGNNNNSQGSNNQG